MIVFPRLVLTLGVLALVNKNFSNACEHENHHHHDGSEEHRNLRALVGKPFWVSKPYWVGKWDSEKDFRESGARCGQREPTDG